MSHSHSHHQSHSHSHSHASGNIGVAFALNTCFALIELVGGLMTNSVAILSDSVHDFGDSLSLGVAWYFEKKSRKAGDAKFTYGYQRFSLVGAFITSIVLIVGSVLIISEAIPRLFNPEHANYKGMLLLAALGIVVNAFAMLRLKRGKSINERAVFLHFLEDVLGWIAVLIGALVMYFFDVPVLDPILSILIAAYVLFNVYRNIVPALRIILQGVPVGVDEEKIRDEVLKDTRIESVHDLRIWSLDGMHHVISLHIVAREIMDLKDAEKLKESTKERLKALDVAHATIEVEYEPEHLKGQAQ